MFSLTRLAYFLLLVAVLVSAVSAAPVPGAGQEKFKKIVHKVIGKPSAAQPKEPVAGAAGRTRFKKVVDKVMQKPPAVPPKDPVRPERGLPDHRWPTITVGERRITTEGDPNSDVATKGSSTRSSSINEGDTKSDMATKGSSTPASSIHS